MRKYFCCDERRREEVRGHSTLNGIDFIEVIDRESPQQSLRQRILLVRCLKNLPTTLTHENLVITGGIRIPSVKVIGAVRGDKVQILKTQGLISNDTKNFLLQQTKPKKLLVVLTESAGDFSTYTLQLVEQDSDLPLAGFDPVLSKIDFSFKADCPSNFDCEIDRQCPEEEVQEPPIHYLAKDYASFRQLILDRYSQLMPSWKETSPADLGITLVELLAYVGDYLSYKQDAVASEAYLGTARSRVSIRRHARLVDYRMHDGCNARACVQVAVQVGNVELPRDSQLFTKVNGFDVCISPGSVEYESILRQRPAVFESLQTAHLYQEHNRMPFYTWGDQRCCLPKGATKATLKGAYPILKAGEVLIFMQERDPETGTKEDADLRGRHALRLTHVVVGEDPLNSQPVTEITWNEKDALPFPLCISSTQTSGGDQTYREDLSLALGNIVLVDHGRTLPEGAYPEEECWDVPQPQLYYAPNPSAETNRCQPALREMIPPRFRPQLREMPLTQAVPLQLKGLFTLAVEAVDLQDLDNKTLPQKIRQRFRDHGVEFNTQTLSIQGSLPVWSVSDGTTAFLAKNVGHTLEISTLPPAAQTIASWGPEKARPALELLSGVKKKIGNNITWMDLHTWLPVPDLLNSESSAREFVVEIDAFGATYLRFGDDICGRRPESGYSFRPRYRIGNGVKGNVGAETIYHLVTSDPGAIQGVWNLLPAQGGVEPEDMDAVRQLAPYVFRNQERAVTLKDYETIANWHPKVQRAAAVKYWTGSWNTIYLFVDRKGGYRVDTSFERDMLRFLEKYRLAGDDLEIVDPDYVPLEIELTVCLEPDYLRSEASQELLRLFSAGRLLSGEQGVFHPDQFTFGQPVYLSQLYAAAEKVEGIQHYQLTVFQRLGYPSQKGLDEGKLTMNRLEVARLDNDSNYPEHGVFRLKMEGGR